MTQLIQMEKRFRYEQYQKCYRRWILFVDVMQCGQQISDVTRRTVEFLLTQSDRSYLWSRWKTWWNFYHMRLKLRIRLNYLFRLAQHLEYECAKWFLFRAYRAWYDWNRIRTWRRDFAVSQLRAANALWQKTSSGMARQKYFNWREVVILRRERRGAPLIKHVDTGVNGDRLVRDHAALKNQLALVHRQLDYFKLGAKDAQLRAVSILQDGKLVGTRRGRFMTWLRWLEHRGGGAMRNNGMHRMKLVIGEHSEVDLGAQITQAYSNGGITSPAFQRRALHTALPPSTIATPIPMSPSPLVTTA